MKLATMAGVLLTLALCHCGPDASAPQPVTEVQETIATQAEAAEPPEAPEEVVDETCPHVVLAPELPLIVRAGPNAATAQVGELSNGSVARVSETRDDWAHLTSPLEGWVERSNVYDTCESPAAVPALALGSQTYLLVTEWGEASSRAGVALSPPSGESEMGFRRRDVRPLEPPMPVTLVTKSGACVREAARRVVLIGHCPDERRSTAVTALEVDSCSELSVNETNIAAPAMVGVFGRHEGAVLADWDRAETATSEQQRSNISRFIESSEVPEVMKKFGESEWGWVAFENRIWLMRGDDVLDILDESASDPMQVRVGTKVLAAVGNDGNNGFYMFPNASVPEQARELGYPAFNCRN